MEISPFFSTESSHFHPISPSKLSLIERCGLATDLKYIKKIKEKDIPLKLRVTVDSAAAEFGTAQHRMCELVREGKTLDTALEVASSEGALEGVLLDEVQMHKDAVTIFSRRLDTFNAKFSIGTEIREMQLAVDKDLVPSDYWGKETVLRGKSDIILITEDKKTAVVIDLKTSKKDSIEYAADQLEFYTTLVFAHFPEVTTIRNGLYFLRLATMRWIPTIYRRESFPLDGENPIIKKVNKYIKTYYETPLPFINKNPLCRFCVYKGMCKQEIKNRKR